MHVHFVLTSERQAKLFLIGVWHLAPDLQPIFRTYQNLSEPPHHATMQSNTTTNSKRSHEEMEDPYCGVDVTPGLTFAECVKGKRAKNSWGLLDPGTVALGSIATCSH